MPVKGAVTARNHIPGIETTHPEIIQLLLYLPRILTPGCCVTLAGDRPLFASTRPGTWTILNARMMQALNRGVLAQTLKVMLRGPPTLIWPPLRGLTLEVKTIWLVLRELQVGEEALLLATSLTLVGENLPTTLSPQVALVAGGILQQEAPPLISPKMVISPGERSQLGGVMILMLKQHPKAGVSNPKQPTAGAIVEGAIMQQNGESQKRAKRVPPILDGRERQEVGRKNHEAGGCLLQDLEYLELEGTLAGESQFASVQVDLPKVGGVNLRMGPVAVVEERAWALGVALVQ